MYGSNHSRNLAILAIPLGLHPHTPLFSITYDLCVIVNVSLLATALANDLSLNSIQNQAIAVIWPSLSRIVAISLSLIFALETI